MMHDKERIVRRNVACFFRGRLIDKECVIGLRGTVKMQCRRKMAGKCIDKSYARELWGFGSDLVGFVCDVEENG